MRPGRTGHPCTVRPARRPVSAPVRKLAAETGPTTTGTNGLPLVGRRPPLNAVLCSPAAPVRAGGARPAP